MKIAMKCLLFTGVCLVVPQSALADSAEGKRIVMQGTASGTPPCSACHGADLRGVVALHAPALAGRTESYILARLEHYAGPNSHNAQMKQVATSLDQNQRREVAAYIAKIAR